MEKRTFADIDGLRRTRDMGYTLAEYAVDDLLDEIERLRAALVEATAINIHSASERIWYQHEPEWLKEMHRDEARTRLRRDDLLPPE